MKETERIATLFSNLYDGDPWIDVTIVGTLYNIPASKAAFKPDDTNSIWQIVNHLISWRKAVLKRVQGETIITPDNNFIADITDTSEKNWKDTLTQLGETQKQWLDFLKNFNEDDFEKVYAGNNTNYYEHIHGIIQHDAYHLGQIVLLSKIK